MTILAPYRSSLKTAPELHAETLSQEDDVERAGYISAEQKIQSFMDSGTLLQNYRGNSQEFDYDGGETDADPDSPEYLEELTADSEKDDLAPLPQFNDRIELLEQAASLQKRFNEAETAKRDKTRNAEKAEEKDFLHGLQSAVTQAVKDGLKQSDGA